MIEYAAHHLSYHSRRHKPHNNFLTSCRDIIILLLVGCKEINMDAIRKEYIDTSFGQIHVRMTARRFGAIVPIVLLHQTASSSAMFEGLMAEMAKECWLIAPDTPGFGASAWPTEPPTIPLYAQTIHEALMMLGVRECWLFGHHTGAAIAVEIAARFPHLILKLVLSGPPYLDEAQKERLLLDLRTHKIQPDGSHLVGIWENIRALEPEADLQLSQRETLLTLQAGANDAWASLAAIEYDFAGALEHITCPTLVMAGEHDSLRACVEPTVSALPNAEVRILSDAGSYYICDRQPERVARHIRAFIQESLQPGQRPWLPSFTHSTA